MRLRDPQIRVFLSLVALTVTCLPGHAGEPGTVEPAAESVEQTIADKLRYNGEIQIAILVKGGVSLGAYEAGINWTLLRYLKTFQNPTNESPEVTTRSPRLMAAAGASAGAINGVLSAAYWCAQEFGVNTKDCRSIGSDLTEKDKLCDTVESNIIRDTWVGIDITALLDKKNRTLDENPEDNAVFSRTALRAAQDSVQRFMEQARFTEGCEVPIGITLTRADPIRIDNAGVEVANQRLVAPLILTGSSDNTLEVAILPLKADDRAFRRSVIHLDDPLRAGEPQLEERNNSAGAIQREDLIRERSTLFQAIKASASFPVAFAPIKLSYCVRYTDDDGEGLKGYIRSGADHRCLPGFRRQTSYFVDGGVFDNDPVGVIRHLVESRDPRIGATRYINIDPSHRRQPRALRRLHVTPFNQPGDSIDVELLAGAPPDTNKTSASDAEPHKVPVRLCGANGAEKASFDVTIHETGPRTRRFVGSVHTVPAVLEGEVCQSRLRSDGLLATCHDEEIRFFYSKPPDRPCESRQLEPDNGTVAIGYDYSAVVRAEPQGLFTQLGFVAGAIESARSNELYKEMIGRGWRDGLAPRANGPKQTTISDNEMERPIFQAARLTPLVGDHIMAFGAFLDKRFREFDYYAGVYDGVYGLAEFACHQSDDADKTCLADKFQSIYSSVCPECKEMPTLANVVVRHLIELDACGVSAIINERRDCKPEEWQWIDKYEPKAMDTVFDVTNTCRTLRDDLSERDVQNALALASLAKDESLRMHNELLAIGRALVCAEEITRDRDRDPFIAFIQQLTEDPRFERQPEMRDNKKVHTPIGRMLAKHKRPTATWYYPLADAAISQLLPLEKKDIELRNAHQKTRGSNDGALKAGLAVFGLATETTMADRTGWQWHLSSIPPNAKKWSNLAPLLPNEVAVDTRNGGANLFWEAGWRSTTKPYGVSFRTAPYLRQRFGGEVFEFAELTGFVFYKTNDALFSSAGIGPTYAHSWTDPVGGKRETIGASAYLGLLGDKVRIAYGLRSFSHKDFDGDNIFWQLSVRDVPGFVYWANEAR